MVKMWVKMGPMHGSVLRLPHSDKRDVFDLLYASTGALQGSEESWLVLIRKVGLQLQRHLLRREFEGHELERYGIRRLRAAVRRHWGGPSQCCVKREGCRGARGTEAAEDDGTSLCF
jgi:hypothetical protein